MPSGPIPSPIAYYSQLFIGNPVLGQVYLQTVNSTDPSSSSTQIPDQGSSALGLYLSNDYDMVATPTLYVPAPITTYLGATDAQFLLLVNMPHLGHIITFHDDADVAGTKLLLRTPQVTLQVNDTLLLMYDATGTGCWVEVARSIRSEGGGWGVWTDLSLLNGTGQLQYRSNFTGDVQVRGQVLFTGYSPGTPLAVALMPIVPSVPGGAASTQWPITDFNNNENGNAAILVSDNKLYINTPASSGDPLLDFGPIFYNTASF